MPESGNTLVLDKVSFAYYRETILNEVSFTVSSGTVCGLLGPNGSGKTTLLKCINGLLRVDEGMVTALDRDMQGLSREEIAAFMAVVPQQSNVVFAFTVLDIVVMGRGYRVSKVGAPTAKDYREAATILEKLGMGYLSKRHFNELSGGERQMVLLARALFQDPRILLLDEPTAHLDFKNQFIILDLVKKLTREKDLITVLTIHDPNLAFRYCDQIVMLRQGRVIDDGVRDKVFNSSSLEELYQMPVSMESTRDGNLLVLPGKGLSAG